MFHSNLTKIGLKRYYFVQNWKKAEKRPNGIILNHFISRKLFQKRPNGNPDKDKTQGKCFSTGVPWRTSVLSNFSWCAAKSLRKYAKTAIFLPFLSLFVHFGVTPKVILKKFENLCAIKKCERFVDELVEY